MRDAAEHKLQLQVQHFRTSGAPLDEKVSKLMLCSPELGAAPQGSDAGGYQDTGKSELRLGREPVPCRDRASLCSKGVFIVCALSSQNDSEQRESPC